MGIFKNLFHRNKQTEEFDRDEALQMGKMEYQMLKLLMKKTAPFPQIGKELRLKMPDYDDNVFSETLLMLYRYRYAQDKEYGEGKETKSEITLNGIIRLIEIEHDFVRIERYISKKVMIITNYYKAESEELARQIEAQSSLSIMGIYGDVETALRSLFDGEVFAQPDYVIIYGMLEKADSYKIVRAARLLNENVRVIYYASIDYTIKKEMRIYNISLSFNRHEPVNDFIRYLKELKSADSSKQNEI